MAAQSYDRLEGVIWYDGKLVPWNEANLHVLSHGLHYASCVFEGERAYGGKVFKSTEHSERLKRSANILDFEIPYSVAVEVDSYKERSADMTYISAIIYVERDSQKGIVIGKGGDLIKKISTSARTELETMLGTKVFLDVRVKVLKNWRSDEALMQRLGYRMKDED